MFCAATGGFRSRNGLRCVSGGHHRVSGHNIAVTRHGQVAGLAILQHDGRHSLRSRQAPLGRRCRLNGSPQQPLHMFQVRSSTSVVSRNPFFNRWTWNGFAVFWYTRLAISHSLFNELKPLNFDKSTQVFFRDGVLEAHPHTTVQARSPFDPDTITITIDQVDLIECRSCSLRNWLFVAFLLLYSARAVNSGPWNST